MVDPGDLLPNPEFSSDEDELGEDESWDSDTEEDPPDPWLVNPVQPADPGGFSIYFTNVRVLDISWIRFTMRLTRYRQWRYVRLG